MLNNSKIPGMALIGLGMLLGYAAASEKLPLSSWAQGVDRASPAVSNQPSPCPERQAGCQGLVTGELFALAQHNEEVAARVESADEKPNILVIWGDDIGYWNLSYNNDGMMGYKTPNIDRLAAEGMRFTDYYGEQSYTAGRAAFILGQHPLRTGLTKVGMPGAKEGISTKDPTLAAILKPHGYMTGQFGKNHLGDPDEHLPTNHGFDEFYGNLYHLTAEEEPEHEDYPKDPAFRKEFGPRGVIKSFAGGKSEDTDQFNRLLAEDSTPDKKSPGSVLPFPPTPSGSKAARTMQGSTYKPAPTPRRLPKDAPNILIVLIDDSGPALPDTYGGDVHTPTLSRVARSGLSFNRFHTTAMCSPTRAALLTGRNHHRVGAGVIASLGNDWDGYTGMWPATSASLARVLGCYGYASSAFGKWHNTPHNETSRAGPFDRWPTGRLVGFDYFYGFLAGETSQWEPALVENFNRLSPSHEEGKHLSEDLADKAVTWMRRHRALKPDQPFLMYWAPGAVHGPHHVAKKWADKYKGKFDDGWDAMRERVFARQKKLGYVPENTTLTPRPEFLDAWDDIPEKEKPFQRRLMEVFAGYCEHTDAQVGKLVDELERLEIRDNTLIFYIWGDNGSSAEGQKGTISEFLAQSGTATKIQDHIRVVKELGGLDQLGGPLFDNMYHAGWAWAGSTPFKSTKLVAAHFGGTRNPLAVSWPKGIKPDDKLRTQFHHVNDVVPTVYELLGITAPEIVDGVTQDPIDGTSMAYAFRSADAPGRKKTQYFEIMGSRAIYHNGYMASAFGPRVPWKPGLDPKIFEWTPDDDTWELYDLREDFSQAHDLAEKQPEKLAEMRKLFLAEAESNKAFPIGGGLWIGLHPEYTQQNPATEFHYNSDVIEVPEASAPKLGLRSSLVTIDAELKKDTSGVLYSLGGFSGGIAAWVKDGKVTFEYNLYEIERTRVTTSGELPTGRAKIEIESRTKPGVRNGPMEVTIRVNGEPMAKGRVPRTTGYALSGNDTFDVGRDSYSPVSPEYRKLAPFGFSGQIDKVHIKYLTEK